MFEIFNQVFTKFIIVSILLLSCIGIVVSYFLVPEPLNYYRTSYFEFALPKDWSCRSRKAVFNCLENRKGNKSMITFSAKFRSKEDSLTIYKDHFSKIKHSVSPYGKKYSSKLIYVKDIDIGGRPWIDSVHFASEAPNYYTRYLATVTAFHGILVSFSYHKDVDDRTKKKFQKSIENLKLHQLPV